MTAGDTVAPVRSRGGVDLAAARAAVDGVLADFLAEKAETAADGRLPAEVTELLSGFLAAGGKRLRPLLCVTGWHVAADADAIAPPAVVRAAAALEMFHAFCLIHDDFMDRSATRRGRPTLHRTLAARRTRLGPRAASLVGDSCAVLIGDLALCWSGELLHTAGLSPSRLSAALSLMDTMRTEVMCGQYLDVTHSCTPAGAGAHEGGLDVALQTIRYKTAKYTVERPLHLGAVLADAPGALLDALTAFALPLGEAFQLRDDLLGVFGHPDTTGKPRLDDLREGKHTVLLALGRSYAGPGDRDEIDALVGDPHLDEAGAARIRTLLTSTGARRRVETMISSRRDEALAALAHVAAPDPVLATLRSFVEAATERTH
ncbi:polyprenyl synthetase family protein [Streptomyces sp. WAC06614]|uniref:polyprenyl synthetase family protein n=1 Tax=Streptomyces sp. WAC06614 TaxID=2487416 RepID=UPI000F767A2F|nr:polyprenyl synthetase family protein [Streptomyces sp. WAC06614]RSS84146.1 polyprenyl synthetase family protein [Streptomyces sp. WAC06614]